MMMMIDEWRRQSPSEWLWLISVGRLHGSLADTDSSEMTSRDTMTTDVTSPSRSIDTDHFSGPGQAICPTCVCVCVRLFFCAL